MDIREYSYILAVVDNGTVSCAAEKLFISQPSLTAYIKNLEKRLGFSFFEEGSGKTRLTPEGELYVEYARQIVTLEHNLYRQLEDYKNLKKGVVRIGIPYTRATFVLPELLGAMQRRYPELRLEIREGNSRELEDALTMGEMEFALLNYPFRSAKLAYLPLCEEQFVLVAPAGSALHGQGKWIDGSRYPWLDIREAAQEPFILLRSGHRTRQIADALFFAAGVQPHILYELSSAVTAHRLTEQGVGCSFMLDKYFSLPSDRTEVFCVGEPHPIVSRLVIAHLPERKFSHAARAVISVVRDTMGA